MAEPSTATEMVRVPILGENGRISDDYVPEAIPQAVTAVEQAAREAASSANEALQQAAAAEKAASSATSSVEQAKSYASNASTYMTTAESHAESAATDAAAASQSASDAAASAEAAGKSASSIGTAVFDAQAAATAANESASHAATSASEASVSATEADDSSQDAETSAANAKVSETAAASSAQQAAASATQASSSAEAAAGSATAAAGSAAAAEKSKNDAQVILNEANAKFIESATATTLDPGQPATAEVVDNVLSLGIPQGAKGDKGDTGTGVPDGGTPGQLLAKTDSGTAWVDPPSTGNVLVGTATGYVAHGEDAYAQKPIETRIKGKTWVNRWPVIEGTHNGITVSTYETGLVTVTGTATADADVTADVSGWATGKSYTATISANKTGCNAYFEVQKPSGNTSINASTTGATLNVASDATKCVAGVHVDNGTTVNASFRVMLVDGSTAPDCFVPTGIHSVEPTKLVTAGKNLFQYTKQAGIFFTGGLLQVGTYTMSLESLADWWTNNGGNGRYIYYYMYDSLEAAAAVAGGSPLRGYSSSGSINFANADVGVRSSSTLSLRTSGCILFVAYYGATWIDQVTNLQLELGSTATAYEPPDVTTTPLPEVELRGLPNGTCDELVIGADGTCRVDRKTVEVTFDGSEDEDWYDTATYPGVFQIQVDGADYKNIGIVSDRYSTATGFSYIGDKQCAILSGSLRFGVKDSTYENAAAFKASLATNPLTVTFGAIATTEDQSPVTLPVLPAPTFNQYHDSQVPSDTSVEYARDINIVLANLEAVQAALLGGE